MTSIKKNHLLLVYYTASWNTKNTVSLFCFYSFFFSPQCVYPCNAILFLHFLFSPLSYDKETKDFIYNINVFYSVKNIDNLFLLLLLIFKILDLKHGSMCFMLLTTVKGTYNYLWSYKDKNQYILHHMSVQIYSYLEIFSSQNQYECLSSCYLIKCWYVLHPCILNVFHKENNYPWMYSEYSHESLNEEKTFWEIYY